MKANFVLPALILAKLVCCVALPLAAAGALGGVAAWFAEVPAVAWALLALALAAGGATAWRHSANRARCCGTDVGRGGDRPARPAS